MSNSSLSCTAVRLGAPEPKSDLNADSKTARSDERPTSDFSRSLREAQPRDADSAPVGSKHKVSPASETKTRQRVARKSGSAAETDQNPNAALAAGQSLPPSGKALPVPPAAASADAASLAITAATAAALLASSSSAATSTGPDQAPVSAAALAVKDDTATSVVATNDTATSETTSAATASQEVRATTVTASSVLEALRALVPHEEVTDINASADSSVKPAQTGQANVPALTVGDAAVDTIQSTSIVAAAVAAPASVVADESAAAVLDSAQAIQSAPRPRADPLVRTDGQRVVDVSSDISAGTINVSLIAAAVRAAKSTVDVGAKDERVAQTANLNELALISAAPSGAVNHVSAASIDPALLKLNSGPDSADFPQLLAERISFLADKNASVARLQVDPPQLGPIEVRIEVQGDKAQVWLSAHSLITRDALESSAPRLREALSSQGFTQVNVDVSQRSFQDRSPPRNEWPPQFLSPREDAHLNEITPARRLGALDAYA